MPAMRYSTWLANPSREPSTRPPTSTTIGWNVNGTCVKGSGKLICAAAAVSTVMNSSEPTRIARPSAESATRVVMTLNRVVEWAASMIRLYALPADNQEVLERQRDAIEDAEAGCGNVAFHDSTIEAPLRLRARSAFTRCVIHDADATLRLQRFGKMPQEPDAIRLIIQDIDEEHGIERPFREVGVGGRAKPRDHVPEPLATDAALDRFKHRLLNVFGVHHAVRTDAPCEADGEVTGPRAHVRDCGTISDSQGVHDQLGLLPCGAIRTFEEDQVCRRELASRWRGGRR